MVPLQNIDTLDTVLTCSCSVYSCYMLYNMRVQLYVESYLKDSKFVHQFSSSDVSEFTEVALSFVNTLTEQATETVTIKTFSNQKPQEHDGED